MKNIILSIVGFVLGVLVVVAATNVYLKIKLAHQPQVIIQYDSKIPYEYLGDFVITFYNLNKNRTAQGTEVRDGHTVACDTKLIPANSYIYIEGYGVRQCVDTGYHIKNKRLDIYMNKPTKELLELGVKNRKVYRILEKE